MCVICIEWEKGKLTTKEAYRNMGEVLSTTEDEEQKNHLFELSEKLLESELPKTTSDEEVDASWHKETYDK
jgi:hypothetical protein